MATHDPANQNTIEVADNLKQKLSALANRLKNCECNLRKTFNKLFLNN